MFFDFDINVSFWNNFVEWFSAIETNYKNIQKNV